MTFSIVAGGPGEKTWGVGVASKFLAAGAVVPAARVGAGAIATQSYPNLEYRLKGLELLASGLGATDVVRELTSTDELRDDRQVGVVDRHGGAANFTGARCHSWAGGRCGRGYSVQGNMLVGPQVLAVMEETFLRSSDDLDLADRLLAALEAGDRAGGDLRGRQSAALLVVREGLAYIAGPSGPDDPLLDLRVDDDSNPLGRLRGLLTASRRVVGLPGPDFSS